jgi:hypothetical protein
MALRTFGACSALSIVLFAAACSDDRDGKPAEKTDPFSNARSRDAAATADDEDPSDGFDNVSTPDSGAGSQGAADAGAGSDGTPSDTILPTFPGAGTSNAGDPLPNGMLCDAVAGAMTPIPMRLEQCFFDKNDPTNMVPAATLEQVLECVEEADTVHIRLTFHPWFVDNTYGENSIGWRGSIRKNGMVRRGNHGFNDLVESDHAEIILKDANDAVAMQFKLDYFSADASKPGGYGSLGVLGGEGMMIVGDAAHVVRWMTSQDRNFNERGYDEYTVESPATDENYTPNPEAPEWDFRVVYEAWIDIAAFGSAGFGGAEIEFVHASPSKASSNTIEVEPGECPPCQDPDGCHEDPPPPPPPCGSNDPDEVCVDAGVPTGGTPVPEMVM